MLNCSQILLESAASLKLHGGMTKELRNPEPQLLIFSAKHSEALQKLVDMHKNAILARPDALADTSYTLSKRREFHRYRSFCVASPCTPLEISPTTTVTEPSKLIFTFTGQGAQWAQMGKQLLEKSKEFRASIQAMEVFLGFLPEIPEWSLESVFLPLSSYTFASH